jgi:hypothetical protein
MKHPKRISSAMRKEIPVNLPTLIDITKIPKDIRCSFKMKEPHTAALCDDCTRIAYAEIIKDREIRGHLAQLTINILKSLLSAYQIFNDKNPALTA